MISANTYPSNNTLAAWLVQERIPTLRHVPLDDRLGSGRDTEKFALAPRAADGLQADGQAVRIVPRGEADRRVSGEVRRKGEAHHLSGGREIRLAKGLRGGIDAWGRLSRRRRDDRMNV